jgi:ketosteroid isomerase-like protein
MRVWAMKFAVVILLAAGLAGVPNAQAQGQTEDAAIRAVLNAQVEAWNRGDIPAFMATYENSPETTFVGATSVNKGWASVLDRYKKGYPNKEVMGILTFSELDVRLLPSSDAKTEYAVVTGHFHLARAATASATKDDGIFSLVWHKGAGGWKIVLDHTS